MTVCVISPNVVATTHALIDEAASLGDTRALPIDDDPALTFTRRLGPHGNPRRTIVRPALLQGLRIAAVPGLHTMITCLQGPEHRIRRLGPVPRWHAHA
jgi:hypothetical protein